MGFAPNLTLAVSVNTIGRYTCVARVPGYPEIRSVDDGGGDARADGADGSDDDGDGGDADADDGDGADADDSDDDGDGD